jgi:DNA-binding beta-propeller fold protein YncE
LRRHVTSSGLPGLGIALVAACTASSDEVRPPDDQLFFPTGVAVSPDESLLFALSANSELRFDSGTVSVFDLDEVDAILERWLVDGDVPDGCAQDTTFSETINCDTADFLVAGAGVRIGNFAAHLDVQDLGGGDLRLIIPVRGDPSITYVDWDAAQRVLDCGDADGFPLCDDEHRLTRFELDDDEQIEEEPFDLTVDSVSGFAVVSHLTTARVSLVDLPTDGPPRLADTVTDLFASDAFGRRGTVGVASRLPGPGNMVYVTSLSENRVQTLTVTREIGDYPALIPGEYFFLDRLGANGGGSADGRAIAFGQGGDLAYVMNREPPSVALLDTSIQETGVPNNTISGGTDLCREAASMVVAGAGDAERAYVTCFQDGEVYVVDPRAGGEVEAVTPVGRGPFDLAAAPGRGRLYVSNFFEDSIAVMDLVPGSATQYRVVLRIRNPEAE